MRTTLAKSPPQATLLNETLGEMEFFHIFGRVRGNILRPLEVNDSQSERLLFDG